MALPTPPAASSDSSDLPGDYEANVEVGARRRKLRRGTSSCWECKRRKTRCSFEAGISNVFKEPTGSQPLILLMESILPPATVADQILRRGKLVHLFMDMLGKPIRRLAQSPAGQQLWKASQPQSPTARPILMARRLLLLAICLQQPHRVPGSFDGPGNDRSSYDAADRYFDAASRHVTSQDAWMVSADGLETLLFEGVYHMGAARWQAAWLAFRRGLGIAQVMGLGSYTTQQPGCYGGVDEKLEYLWFRLIHMERFMSLIIGLPCSIVDDGGLMIEETMAGYDPTDKLERVQAVVSGLIVERNRRMCQGRRLAEPRYDHFKETRDLDHELKQAARLLPAKWWTSPALKKAQSQEQLLETYTPEADGSGDHESTFSKQSALVASRELLSRLGVVSDTSSVPSQSSISTAIALALTALSSSSARPIWRWYRNAWITWSL
ncbi:hypothetical protein GQ53DRAFT_760204 [Thozetella sp. PMI_491]|nr:hypothetical protein GQ53DRAFT_760204 [Thozetella sp. PMI_491]